MPVLVNAVETEAVNNIIGTTNKQKKVQKTIFSQRRFGRYRKIDMKLEEGQDKDKQEEETSDNIGVRESILTNVIRENNQE